MHTIGKWLLLSGAVLTFVGLIAGFGFMFAGQDDPAKLFLVMVPLGFLAGFTGIVMTQLGGDG